MNKIINTLLVLSMLAISACELIEVDNTDKTHPIELHLTDDGHPSIGLSWTKTDISSFESYIVVRSSTFNLADLSEPLDNGSNIRIVATIEDFNTNSFTDHPTIVTDSLFYKVFVNIGDRFLFSPVVEVTPTAIILPFEFSDVAYSPKTEQLFFHRFDNINDVLIVVNQNSNNSNVENIHIAPSSQVNLTVKNDGNDDYLFVLDNQNDKLTKYSTSNLTQVTVYEPNKDILSVAMSEQDLIFASVSEPSKPAHIYKGSNPQPIATHNKNVYSLNRAVGYIPNSSNEFIEVSRSKTVHYELDNNGNLNNFNSQVTTLSGPGLLVKVVFSPDGEYFLAFNNGVIYRKDLTVHDRLDAGFNFLNSFEDYVFSQDGKYLYASTMNQLFKFSFPSLEIEDILDFGYITRHFFINDNNNIIVTGKFFNNSTFTYNSVFQTIRF